MTDLGTKTVAAELQLDDDQNGHYLTEATTSNRKCWRCEAAIRDTRAVPTCDDCLAARDERMAARVRRRERTKGKRRPPSSALRRLARCKTSDLAARQKWLAPWWEQMQ